MTQREYLLTCLMEECAELIQRASKALRFGEAEIQPGQSENNFARMVDEYSDVTMVAIFLGLPTREPKPEKLERWTKAIELSKAQGILAPTESE